LLIHHSLFTIQYSDLSMELRSTSIGPAPAPVGREGPQKVRAFIGGHRAFFILLAVLLAQLLLLSVQITRKSDGPLIKVAAVAFFRPFQRTLQLSADGTTWAWSTGAGLWRAQQENRRLRDELAADRSRILEMSEKAAEGDRLRALLDFKQRLPLQTVAAEVIAASPGDNSNAIFIDKGKDSGLATDLAVLTPSGVVGKIITVYEHTSQVLLMTDPSSGVGSILATSRVQGVVKGVRRSQCQLQYVMNEQPVIAGEEVLTSGLDQIYPRGLPVGTVIKVEEGNIYKTILVQPAAALDRLESVLVALKPPTN
jgi:rod shape-determining protein MreC